MTYRTVTETARAEGVSRQTIYAWMRAAGVTPYRLAGLALLSPTQVTQLHERPRKRIGRPPKTKKDKKVLDSALRG